MEFLGWVMPIYLVFDPVHNGEISMVDFANRLLPQIHYEVASDPVLDDFVRLGVCEMTQTTVSLLPLTQPSSLSQTPGVVESPEASLKSVFENLKEWITEDVTDFKQIGYQVYRPTVFMFLGRSTYENNWRMAHHELTDRTLFRFSPNIICCGTSEVSPSIIYDIASTGTQETRALAANKMDSTAGVVTLVQSVIENYVKPILHAPLHATIAPRGFEFPKFSPGISPVTEGEKDFPEEISSESVPTDSPAMLPKQDPDEWKPHVIPFYIVCDESTSPSGDIADFINTEIGKSCNVIAADPIIDEKARLGIIFFSETAVVSLPLSKISDIQYVPGCVTGGPAKYGPVFKLLKSEIEKDVTHLRAEGYAVQRPLVVFMSHGRPEDAEWQNEYKNLTNSDFLFRPNILGFGLPGANREVILSVSTPFPFSGSNRLAFLSDHGARGSDVVREILSPIINS